MSEQHRSRRQVFAAWHREESLFREIYTRTVATLLAGFVAYVVGVLSGNFSPRPLVVVALIAGSLQLLVSFRGGYSSYMLQSSTRMRRFQRVALPVLFALWLAALVVFASDNPPPSVLAAPALIFLIVLNSAAFWLQEQTRKKHKSNQAARERLGISDESSP